MKQSPPNQKKKKKKMGCKKGFNLFLLMAMVATNVFSLYHLSSTHHYFKNPKTAEPPSPQLLPDRLLHQLHTIRASITHLTRLRSTTTLTKSSSSSSASTPSELLLYTHISPIASSCHNHPDLLHQYMNYTPFSLCPPDAALSESLILRGCHPLPRRRCFSRTPPVIPTSPLPSDPFSPLPDRSSFWVSTNYTCKSFDCFNSDLGFNMEIEKPKFVTYKSHLDLPIRQLLKIAKSAKSPIRLGIDIGGGTGTFAAQMKLQNATVITTTMNLGYPFSEAVALRGLVPLHVPLQQRLPVFDGVLDIVRCGHAVNRWIPATVMEFLLFDLDRVLRGGGYLWLDRFFSKRVDLEEFYAPMIGKLGYKIVKWAVGNKTSSGGKVKSGGGGGGGEVYLTALLQKPVPK